MTRNDKILHDLSKHLHEKVADNVEDYMDLCKRAGLRYPHAASELMVFFSHLAASYAASQFKIDEDNFVALMRLQFKRALKATEDES